MLLIGEITVQYHEKVEEFLETAAGGVGDMVSPFFDDPGHVAVPQEDFPEIEEFLPYATYVQLEVLYYDIRKLYTQLVFLAWVSNTNNCIYGPPDTTIPQGTTGGGGTLRSGGDCHSEEAWIEMSLDGGFTWTRVWEGTISVCQEDPY
jgi:hypothetical protein